MRTGELAGRCGVNVQTVRYYERRGLLLDPRGGVDGHREYDDQDVDRVRFIREAQALGFTLKEVADLLALRSGRGTAREVRERARVKLEGVREKIGALRALERNLVELLAGCSGSGPSSACSIIHRLERPAETEARGHGAEGRRKRRRSS